MKLKKNQKNFEEIIIKLEKLKRMIMNKFPLWRQEDTRPVFLKKMKDFWEYKRKKKEN